MKKITILGVRASGKTTLANKLGTLFSIPVTHLDKIFWGEDCVKDDESAVKELAEVLPNDKWIIEGSLPESKTLDMRIAAADTIILYDLPPYILIWRHIKRFLKYINKVRPEIGGHRKGEPFPFRPKVIQHARHYPIEQLYSKVLPYRESKNVIILKSCRDEKAFLNKIHSMLSEKNLETESFLFSQETKSNIV